MFQRDGQTRSLDFPQQVHATVLVDSRDRDYAVYPSSSRFVVNLPETLKNVASATLVSVEIPLSYYVFSAARGTTSLTVARTLGTTVVKTVTIPDGNYTTSSMATALQAALNDPVTGFGAGVFTVTFSSETMKCTLAATGTVSVDTTGQTKQTNWGLGYYLGFPRNAVTSGTSSSVTGTYVASMNPEGYVLLDIEELNNVKQSALYAQGGSSRTSFAKIPIDGDSYQYNYFDKALTIFTYVDLRPNLTRLDRLTMSLRFHDGTLVDLNGGEWSVSLDFKCTLVRGI